LPHTLTGTFRFHGKFQSRFLRIARDVIVYLPPGYNSTGDARYPVLYLHDGQNLFDAATAFLGNEWGLDETADDLIAREQIEPLVIVGIYNTGVERMSEYTPVKDRRGRGGLARNYGKFIVQELKPFIDGAYQTLDDSANTGLGGSSLGGLVSMYLGLKYPRVFGKLIVMSPSVWWANRAILDDVARFRYRVRQRIWLDVGTGEDRNAASSVRNATALRDALIAKGWCLGRDLAFLQDEGAGHNEQAWGRRMCDALKFLFPLGSPPAPRLGT
jgi:predicted alpha/beta superfamily hydrolase